MLAFVDFPLFGRQEITERTPILPLFIVANEPTRSLIGKPPVREVIHFAVDYRVDFLNVRCKAIVN